MDEAAEAWPDVAAGVVVHVVGTAAAELRELPDPAPVVVTWRPVSWIDVSVILAELEWHAAQRSPGWHADVVQPEAVRAAAAAGVIVAASGGARLVLAVDVPRDQTPAAEEAMIAACERVAAYGRFAVWLIAPALHSPRVAPASVALPVRSNYRAPARARREAGRPWSPAEQLLEDQLSLHDWAAGRLWNEEYRPHVMARPIRPDIWWEEHQVMVEVDDSTHWEHPEKYADDRRRDVDLQLAGYVVLRFTNAQVEQDAVLVASRIGQMIATRRDAKRNSGE